MIAGTAGAISVDRVADADEAMYSRDVDDIAQASALKAQNLTMRLSFANAALTAEGPAKVEAEKASEAAAQQMVQELDARTTSKTGPKVAEGLDRIIELKRQTAAQEKDAARSMANGAILRILLASLLGLALGLYVAWRVARDMVRGLTAIQRVAQNAAHGDLSDRTGVTSGDETGRAAQALDSSLDQLGGIITQVRRSSDDVTDAVEEMSVATRSVVDGARQASGIDGIARSAQVARDRRGGQHLAGEPEPHQRRPARPGRRVHGLTTTAPSHSGPVPSTWNPRPA